MNRGVSVALLMLLGLTFRAVCGGAAFAERKTLGQIQAEFDRESSPKKRLKLAIDLTDQRLKQTLAAYAAEDASIGPQELEQYLAGIDRFEKAIEENLNNISKNAEIHLRKQLLALENLKLAVSYTERAPVEEAAKRVSLLHDAVLHRIMKPRKD